MHTFIYVHISYMYIHMYTYTYIQKYVQAIHTYDVNKFMIIHIERPCRERKTLLVSVETSTIEAFVSCIYTYTRMNITYIHTYRNIYKYIYIEI